MRDDKNGLSASQPQMAQMPNFGIQVSRLWGLYRAPAKIGSLNLLAVSW